MASTSDSSSMTNDHKDLKVYVASVSGSAEIRKQIQWTLMVLDGLNVPFSSIDITVRGNEVERDFMRENAVNKRCPECVPMPPQFFHRDEYLGNYADFEEAVENNILEEFLRLIPPDDIQDTDTNRGKKKTTTGVDEEKISVEESDEDEEVDEEEEEDEDEEYEDEGDEEEDEDEGEGEDEEYDEDEESDQEQPTASTSEASLAAGIKSSPQSSVPNKPASKPTLVDGKSAPTVKKEKTPPKKTAPVPPSKIPTEQKVAPTTTAEKDKTLPKKSTPAPPPNAGTKDVAKSGAAQGLNKVVNKPLQNDIKAAAPKPPAAVTHPAKSTLSATASTTAARDKNVTASKPTSGAANGTIASSKPAKPASATSDTLANSVSPLKSTATKGVKVSDKEHTTDFTMKLPTKGEEKASVVADTDDDEEEDEEDYEEEEYEEEDIDEEEWTYEEVDEEEAVEELPDDKTQTTKK